MMLSRVRFILCALLCMAFAGCKREEPPPPATAPATQPATAPATKPALTDYVELLRLHDLKVPATQPLSVPVDLEDAGHYLLTEPVHLCGRGDLWITHPDAPPIAEVLAKAADEQLHLTREHVLFVQWFVNENRKLAPRVAIKTAAGFAWRDAAAAHPITRHNYRWRDGFVWNDRVVVPTDRGVSMFSFDPEYSELHHELVGGDQINPPRVLLDARGLLAWSPWEGDKPGGQGAWRFVDDKWIDLAATAKWPEKIIHLVPLLDGSVLQLIAGEEGKLNLSLAVLDAPGVDENAILALVEQLAADDPQKREQAYAELTRFGPASWPVLERVREEQMPEARFRIEALLRDRIQPTLGGKTLIDGRAIVADRLPDGGVLLHAPGGVSMPQENKPPLLVKPAWITIRPGQAIELLEPVLAKNADPQKHRFFAFGNEWIVSDDVQGPRRLLGNHLESMLKKDELKFNQVVGFDRRGRWLFKTSPDAPETLVLDPTVPDPTPRLPVWLIAVDGGISGWSNEDWPAINRGGPRSSWMLVEHGWAPLDERRNKLNTDMPKGVVTIERRAPSTDPETNASTRPVPHRTTAPATTTTTTRAAATLPADPPILIDTEGRRYYDGRETLRVIDPDGNDITWKFPATAASDSDFNVVLIRAADGLLFLFNAPGRVVRIKPTPDADEPFIVEAIFTHRIPNDADLRRIWLDPAGRIIIAYQKHRLAIMFPSGRIPSDIAKLMLASEREQNP